MSYGMLKHNVDEEQFRPFTVTVRQIQDEGRKKRGKDRTTGQGGDKKNGCSKM